jgi:hypothetical protein
VITREELQAMAMNFGRRSESGGNPPAPASASTEGSGRPAATGGDSSGAQPRFVRFRRPHEKLPEGLPDWFVQRDKDEDGQIGMAEFASIWNDAVVAEFFRYDLDGDGIITPRECLDALAGKTGVAGGAAPAAIVTAASPASPQVAPGTGDTDARGGVSASASGPRSSSQPARSAWDDPGSNFW